MKKRTRGRKSTKKISSGAFSGALRDINVEIKTLNHQKSKLKKFLINLNTSIDSEREREKVLQEKIAALIAKEAQLNERKKKLQTQIDDLADRMGKVSKIKSEMSSI